MKKILSFFCALLIVFQSFAETQDAPQKETPAKDSKNAQEFNDADIDYNYFGKPLDTKNGIERQIQELNDLIKKKRDEKNSWPQIQSAIEAKINSITNKKLNIKKQIDDLAKITDPTKLASKLMDILSSVPNNRGYWNDDFYLYTDDNSILSIKSFVIEINSRTDNSINDKTSFFEGLSKDLSDIVYKRGDRYSSNTPLQLSNTEKETINTIRSQLSGYDWESYFGGLITVYNNAKQDAINKISGCNDDIKKLNGLLDNLYKSLEENDKNINVIAITWGLPIFCLTIIFLFGISFWYGKVVNKQSIEGENATEGLSKILLEIITVLLLTMTVLILGLSGRITENVLGTLLGGVAGYILNRTKPS